MTLTLKQVMTGIGAFLTLSAAVAAFAGGGGWVVDTYTGWHDGRYVQVSEHGQMADALINQLQEEQRQEQFKEAEDEIAFLESAIEIKRGRRQDATLEELSLKKAERKYDRLKKLLEL